MFTTERGRKVVNFNCLICHSETINGAVVVGLGITTRDFTGNLALIANALDVLKPTLEEGDRVEVQRFSRTIAPYTRLSTVGVNPAVRE